MGLREPLGTFQVFRTAFCADAPHLEYRCLSREFLEDNRIEGQVVYREFRERLIDSEPFLRYALAKARVGLVERTGPRTARLEARTMGRTVRVSFVREDFWEIWDDQGALDGATLRDFKERGHLREHPDRGREYEFSVPADALSEAEALTEVRLGREWKIRSLELVEDSASD
jgi:hypothetical protein